MTELESLVKRCAKDDRKAQQEFFKIYYGKFMGVARRLSPNDDVAQDIIQEAFIKMFKNLHTLDTVNESIIFSWGKRIITNCVIDFYRREKRFMHDFDIGDIPSEWIEDEETTYLDFKNIEQHQIIEAIQSLSPQFKLVFNMYSIDGLTHDEIGETLGISVGTSKSNLSRARVRLRKKLEEYVN